MYIKVLLRLAVAAWITLCSTLMAAETSLSAGDHLSYQGTLTLIRAAADAGQDDPGKSFDLTYLLTSAEPGVPRFDWVLDERGPGGWSWIERFGTWSGGRAGDSTAGNPSLLHAHASGNTVVPLLAPLLSLDGDLAVGKQWSQGELQYRVEQAVQQEGRDAWQIDVRNRLGRYRTLWIDKSGNLVVAAKQRVFVGQGGEYELAIRLAGVERLSDDVMRENRQAADALAGLRTRMGRTAKQQQSTWTAADLERLAAELPAIEKLVSAGPMARLVRSALRDVELQTGQADSIARKAGEFQGRLLREIAGEQFNLAGLGRDGLRESDLAGKVTVLHFWEYRDKPLVEPYGQVGYLEFLHSRRRSQGVRVCGVAVDNRLDNPDERSAAMAGIRSLRSFMNLTYPVLLDGGRLIRKLGDPRMSGGKLPVFVVVGPDGAIAHYHVGYYQVDQNVGLKELDAIVVKTLADRDAKQAK